MIDSIWPHNANLAVSLTFDDARISQIYVGMKIFAKFNIPATFYVSLDQLKQRTEEWRRAVQSGHEIGNHTTKHPCGRNFPFARDNSLESLDLDAIKRDCAEADDTIRSLLHVETETFAYPCGQSYIGEGAETKSYVPVIASRYKAARGFGEGWVNDASFCNMHMLSSFASDTSALETLKRPIDSALSDDSINQPWVIYTGHEIGDASIRQTTGSDILKSFVDEYATDNRVWFATVSAVADRIIKYSSSNRNRESGTDLK